MVLSGPCILPQLQGCVWAALDGSGRLWTHGGALWGPGGLEVIHGGSMGSLGGEGCECGWAVVSSSLGLVLAMGLPHFGGPKGVGGLLVDLPFRPCLGGPSPPMPRSWGVGAWWGMMHGF